MISFRDSFARGGFLSQVEWMCLFIENYLKGICFASLAIVRWRLKDNQQSLYDLHRKIFSSNLVYHTRIPETRRM